MNSASRCSSERVSRLYPSEPRLASLLTVCGWARRGMEDRVGGGAWRTGWEEGRGGEGGRRGVEVRVGGGVWR